jgi:DNA-binding MarR family transcriptional regulator
LSAVPEAEVTRLAEAAFLHPPSLSRILRDLTDRGLVRRRTPDTDLRRGLVSITEEGAGTIARLEPELAAANDAIDALCGEDRIEALRGILGHLERVL